jgi:hypothetical protein
MSVLSIAALKAQVNADVNTNGVNAITGAITNAVLINLIDSMVNKIDGASFFGLSTYDPTRTYTAGLCCLKDTAIMRCFGTTTGTYDPTKWENLTGIKSLTLAQLQDIVVDNVATLVPGTFVLISDRNVLLPVVGEYAVDSRGTYWSYEPDYTAFNCWVDNTITASYAINDKVARNRQVYKRINAAGNSTTPPESDATNWLLLATSDPAYILNQFTCVYDVVTDWHSYRADNYGNEVWQAKSYAHNNLETFQWGNPARVYGNKMYSDVSICNVMNITFNFYNNTAFPGAYIENIISTTSGSIIGFCTFEGNSNFYNVLLDNSVDVSTMTGTTIRTGGSFDEATIYSVSFGANSINYRVTGYVFSVSSAEGVFVDENFVDVTPLLGGPIDCSTAFSSGSLDVSDIGGKNLIMFLDSAATITIVEILVNQNVRKIRFYASDADIEFQHGATLLINGAGLPTITSNNNFIELTFNDPASGSIPYESGRLIF